MNGRADIIKFIKFAATGLLNTAVDAGVFALLLALGTGTYLAQTVSYGCGMLSSYLINRSWTFGSREGVFSSAAVRFITANLGLLVFSLGVLYLVEGTLGLPVFIAKAAAICCTVGLGFMINRLWVFK